MLDSLAAQLVTDLHHLSKRPLHPVQVAVGRVKVQDKGKKETDPAKETVSDIKPKEDDSNES